MVGLTGSRRTNIAKQGEADSSITRTQVCSGFQAVGRRQTFAGTAAVTLRDSRWTGPPPSWAIRAQFLHRVRRAGLAHQAGLHHDPADGKLLGNEGSPQPSVTPAPTVALVTAGHPEVSCTKGQFQGCHVWLTRPGQAQKDLGVSLGRHFEVAEPLPAAGTAEIWSFVAQYVHQNAPPRQMNPPVSITMRG